MRLATSIFVAAFLTGSTSAQITYVSQVRSVEANARSSQAQGAPILDSDQIDAVGFVSFQEDLTVSTSSAVASGTGRASQTSDLSDALMTAVGYGTGWGNGSDPNGFGSGDGQSSFQVTFDLTTECDVTLTGSLSVSQFGFATTSFSSQQASLFLTLADNGNTVTINETFTLPPGRYSLSARASGYGYGDPWIGEMESATFDLQLAATPSPVGTSDCSPPGLNSNGSRASLGAIGSRFVSSGDLALHVEGAIPGQAGLFFYGMPQAPAPFGGGTLCLGGSLFRLSPAIQAGASGDASYAVDFGAWPVNTGPGAFVGGATWAFQFWYRDPGDLAGFTVSDRYTIAFQ